MRTRIRRKNDTTGRVQRMTLTAFSAADELALTEIWRLLTCAEPGSLIIKVGRGGLVWTKTNDTCGEDVSQK